MNKIIYNNFAPGAAENAVFNAEESSLFQSMSNLSEIQEPVNFASFEGPGIDLLDNSLLFAGEDDFLGIISSDISDANKSYGADGITLVFDLDSTYSCPEIRIHFFEHCCTNVKIDLYDIRGLLELHTLGEYCQWDGLDCYVNENNGMPMKGLQFNKIKITFYKSESTNQFVKIKSIDFGNTKEITEFLGAISIFEELDPRCTDLPCDTCDFEAIFPSDITPLEGQSFYVYHNSSCFGKFTADKISDNENHRFIFESSDDKATLKRNSFSAISGSAMTVNSILDSIYDSSHISVDPSGYGGNVLTGFIQSKDCRYAAEMLSMGTGLFISSARNRKLRMFSYRNRKSTVIGSDRILGKADYIKNAPFTSAVLLVHGGSEFNSNTAVKHTRENPSLTGHVAANELRMDKYSLFSSNPSARLDEIVALGLSNNEIHAEIILGDEQIGDILSIETPYGLKTGMLKSLDICMQGSELTAKAIFLETEV